MKAVFTGSLSEGFKIDSIADDATAEARAIALLADGRQIAEAMNIEDPKRLDAEAEADPMGVAYVVCGKGLDFGFTLYGPFSDQEAAQKFAEYARRDYDDWEIFEAEAPKFLYTPIGRAWGHIFSGKSESMCRFAFDLEQGKLVYLDIMSDQRWQAASAAEMADFEDSLKNANEEAFESPKEYDLTKSFGLPDWMDAQSQQQILFPLKASLKP